MNVSDFLKQEMVKRELTVRKLSEKAGVSRGIISEITTGSSTNPSIKTVAKIAKALDIPIKDFIGGIDIE